jgi:GH24 family phage-related lysozyme (muramidase)
MLGLMRLRRAVLWILAGDALSDGFYSAKRRCLTKFWKRKMKEETLKKLKARIKDDEAYRAYPYDDITGIRLRSGDIVQGNPTIGYGFTYLTEIESDHVLQLKLTHIIENNLSLLPETVSCNDARLIVIISMIYQLGYQGYFEFMRMRGAILAQDWQTAYNECLDSHAYRYGLPGVKKRFEWYAKTLRDGK